MTYGQVEFLRASLGLLGRVQLKTQGSEAAASFSSDQRFARSLGQPEGPTAREETREVLDPPQGVTTPFGHLLPWRERAGYDLRNRRDCSALRLVLLDLHGPGVATAPEHLSFAYADQIGADACL